MASRPKGYGFTAEIKGKMAAKYEIEKEQEARLWIEDVLGEPINPDVNEDEPLGPERFHEALKDGIILCKLADRIVGPGKVKYNKMKVPFKQMENINNFLLACEKLGVAKTDLFQTVDLYENQNMWQVVLCLFALGRKAQAIGFDGPALGPREANRNVREFSDEQLKAGQGIIGLQMGTNQLASQKGMSFGNTRHIADIKCDNMSKEGQGVIGLQMGSNKGASQSGMSFGNSRHIADIKCDDLSKDGQNIIGLQMGSNQGASQKGMSFGNSRHIADIKCDELSKESQSTIGLQMGSNLGANQSGVNFGKSRGIIGVDS